MDHSTSHAPPDTRVQRTRLRSPLTRRPLGGVKLPCVGLTSALIGALFIIGCGRAAPLDPPSAELVLTPPPYRLPVETGTYVGHIVLGFEVRAFRPCGAEELWWVESDSATAKRIRALVGPGAFNVQAAPTSLFLKAKASLYGNGHFGHQGDYLRELHLTEIVEVRAAGSRDCEGG